MGAKRWEWEGRLQLRGGEEDAWEQGWGRQPQLGNAAARHDRTLKK